MKQEVMQKKSPIYCAIDTNDLSKAILLSHAAQKAGCGVKLGLEFFNRHGPQGVKTICDFAKDEGFEPDLFLDLKYHDIPNTVAGAIESIASVAPSYLNIHAAGGLEMMKAAKAACPHGTRLLAVTVLTSLDECMLRMTGIDSSAPDQVERLALLAAEAGLDGVVCSGHEITRLRKELGSDFVLMVPGIRPAGSDAGDQKRVITPVEALRAGASHLVIGRPITQAQDPERAARAILESLCA